MSVVLVSVFFGLRFGIGAFGGAFGIF